VFRAVATDRSDSTHSGSAFARETGTCQAKPCLLRATPSCANRAASVTCAGTVEVRAPVQRPSERENPRFPNQETGSLPPSPWRSPKQDAAATLKGCLSLPAASSPDRQEGKP
jgi:hypothetical protein